MILSLRRTLGTFIVVSLVGSNHRFHQLRHDRDLSRNFETLSLRTSKCDFGWDLDLGLLGSSVGGCDEGFVDEEETNGSISAAFARGIEIGRELV